MLSVVIATHDDAFRLVPTLAALVPGATAGLISEVIVADAGSSDDTAEVADIAGCRLIEAGGPTGARYAAGAAAARGRWLLFLRPGIVLDPGWIAEARGFIEAGELSGRAEHVAAVFRRAPSADAMRPALIEALWFLAGAIAARPRPEQGLLIAARHYARLGGHAVERPDAERQLLRRLGRRRIVTLRSGASTLVERDQAKTR